jgi:hypothetical protein
MAEPERTARAAWLLLGAAAVILVVHSLAYDFVTDDAYISFVFSRNLAEHGQLAFNLGQPVEGYTSFLWTFVLGLGMLAGVPPEWSSRVLGTGCALATLYVVFRLAERALGRRTPWAAVPALLLACSSGFACWTSGGLETQLFTMLCVIAVDGVSAAEGEGGAGMYRAGVALALAAMTRPEGVLVALALGVVRITCNIIAKRKVVGRTEIISAICFLGLWAPWFAWRWWYYGWLFPNTYYVKASGPWINPELPRQMLDNGLYYVWVWLRQSHLVHVLPLAVLGLVAVRRGTPRLLLSVACTVFSLAYLAYTVSVGGDFMGLHRFIMPMFVVAALAVTLGAEWLAGKLRPVRALGRAGALIAPALAALLVGGFAVTQLQLTRASLRWGNFDADRGIDTPAFLIAYTEDRAAIGRAMASCFRPDDFSIVGGAGAQPYFGRMRGVDVFGLVSDTIAHDEPRIRARAGHTKFGSDRVLAAYDPTFVFSCYQIHAKPTQPALPCAGTWLARGFEPVTMHIPGLRLQGEYYTFLARKTRDFQCPGRVQ